MLTNRGCTGLQRTPATVTSQKELRIAGPIAIFAILADAIDVKRGDQLGETVSQPSIQPDKVARRMGSGPRPCLDFDHIGQN